MQVIDPVEVAEHPMAIRGFDRVLTIQRPVVLAHIRGIRARHPDASPARVIQILERRYLTAITSGGAGVGAAAAIPAVGTGTSLVLIGVETVGFLETTALFAQSVTELHGIAVTDRDRARTIVMAMMLGPSGADLVRNFAAQATGAGVPQSQFWGTVIGKNVPKAFMGQIADRMQKSFVGRFTRNATAGAVGRLIPFGIGAVVGGTANHMLGRKVVTSSRLAFGPPPNHFTANLEPRVKAPKTIRVRGGSALIGLVSVSKAIVRPVNQLGQKPPGRKIGTGKADAVGVDTESNTGLNTDPNAGPNTGPNTGPEAAPSIGQDAAAEG